MKIILISFLWPEYIIQLANALSMTENVMLMFPKEKVEGYLSFINRSVDLRLFHCPRYRDLKNVSMLYKILKDINRYHADIIHLQEGHPWFNLVLPFIRKRHNLVNTVHDVRRHTGDKPSKKAPQCIHRLAPRFATKIIVHGDAMKRQMFREYHIHPKNVYAMPRGNALIMKYGVTSNIKEKKNSVLFFGRIWEYKGLQYLIKAEPLITKEIPNAKIVIAGEGEDFTKYESMMINRNNFIVYNHYISNEMMCRLFSETSAVVLPYIDGSISGVVPIAYSFQKPVVVTNVGSISEIVDDGETGFIVPPANSEQLAQAVIYLLQHPQKRKEMGKKAFIKATTELSWSTIAAKTLHVYQEIVRNK